MPAASNAARRPVAARRGRPAPPSRAGSKGKAGSIPRTASRRPASGVKGSTRARAKTNTRGGASRKPASTAKGSSRGMEKDLTRAGAARKKAAAAKTRVQARKQTARHRGANARADAARSAVARTEPAYFVLVPTAALLLMGLVMVFSAGSVIGMGQSVGGYKYFIQQIAWAALGLGLMVFLWKFDYHKIGKLSWIGVIVSIGLLGLVPFYGWAAYGSKRWLSVGPVNIQPTEIAKFTLVVFAAYVLAMKGDSVKRLFHLIVPVVLVTLVEAAMILKQPDLGSTLVLCFSVFLVMAVARTRVSHLAGIATVGGAAALYFAISAPYRRARMFSFIDPWKAPRGAGYQVIQSYIALGSGSIKGLGLGMSRQKFLYLPNAHTDFIFAIIGEELGLIGTMVVLALIGLLAYGGFRIATRAPDELGRLLAAGITGLIVIQALVNMGGVTGLLPITGVPLPLVSSGGSSLCVCLGCIGMLMNIAAQSSR